MTAWHGSPHKFDKFRMSKIGTGEGAQAYGHGLYFAENKGVAGGYKSQLSSAKLLRPDGSAMETDVIGRHAGDLLAQHGNDYEKARRGDLGSLGVYKDEITEWLDVMEGQGIKADLGHLYEVDIPDEAIDKMLDWDARLSEQPENFKALQDAARKIGRDDIAESLHPDETGGAAYIYLTGAIGDSRLADMGYPSGQTGQSRVVSEALNELGIPGIRYLDGSSRGAGEGTRNMVLFDENLAAIRSRNGNKP